MTDCTCGRDQDPFFHSGRARRARGPFWSLRFMDSDWWHEGGEEDDVIEGDVG
jgi:hypothetical protein